MRAGSAHREGHGMGGRLLRRVRRHRVAVRSWVARAQDFCERKTSPIWWTRRRKRRRTSPGLQRPDKQREHLAEACRAAAAQPVSVSLAWEAGRRKVGFEKPSEEASTVAASELRGISLVHALTRLSSDHPTFELL